MKLSTRFFKQSLNAHSWMGLFVGAVMYLICLSGTLAVYFEEMERWEQPKAQEYLDYNLDTVDRAFNQLISDPTTQITPHMYVTLPTSSNPRVGLITENEGWFIDQDGAISSPTSHPLTDVLTELHLYLHLPKSIGMIIVSAFGVLLLSLIISGFASHRTIFKDAFKLRVLGNKQLEQTDIHNRLSVWAAPFHLMIAMTGAFFGFAMVVVYLYAAVFQNNDFEGVTQTIFGQEPELNQKVGRIELAKAIKQVTDLAPDTSPILAIVHDTGTPSQFIEVFSQYPNRLIYSDNFVFDADGNFIQRKGFSDGVLGKQIIYSMYRLHFGHFGGWWTKLVYFLLGLALTVISVSGINIWLAKRKYRDAINHVWVGFVWGAPIGLIVPAISYFLFGYASSAVFWLSLIVSSAFCYKINDERRSRAQLQFAAAVMALAVIILYCFKFEAASLSEISLTLNGAILVYALSMFAAYLYYKKTNKKSLQNEAKKEEKESNTRTRVNSISSQ